MQKISNIDCCGVIAFSLSSCESTGHLGTSSDGVQVQSALVLFGVAMCLASR